MINHVYLSNNNKLIQNKTKTTYQNYIVYELSKFFFIEL